MIEIDLYQILAGKNDSGRLYKMIEDSIDAELERLEKLKQERMETKARNKEDMRNFLKNK